MTIGLFRASYGLSSANFRVRILEVGTGTPAMIMLQDGTVVNTTGETVIDAYGNLAVYLDMSRTWGVHINQYTLAEADHTVATFVQRSALQLASPPTAVDKQLGPGAIFYDPNHPETNYRVAADGNTFVQTSGSGGGGGGGVNGLNNATILLYQRATSAPNLPNLTATYTFASGTITGLSNGWQPTIPAGTDPIWVTASTASSSLSTDTIAPNEWSTPVILSQNGLNSATVYIFQRTTSAVPPALPDIPTVYTFASGILSGLDNGWSQTMPTTGGAYRWMATATALATGGITTDTILASEWATPSLVAQDGATGANGLNNANVWAYQRSAGGAPALPSATVTYAFANAATSGLNNGWSSTPPSGTDPLYVTVASATSATATDTIAPNEWATPVILVQNGSDGATGLNNATVFLYKVTTTNTAPPLPSAAVTFTFATGIATGMDNGWTQALPSTGGSYRWITTATALGTGATDVITPVEWATVSLFSADGAVGPTGTTGATGAAGPTGPAGTAGLNNAVVFVYQRAASTPAVPSSPVTYVFATAAISGLTNGWQATIPAGSNPLYVASATASGSGTSDVIATNEWATPVILSQDGLAGLNAATVYLFQRTSTGTPPAVPSGTVTYTFSTGAASGLTNGWSQSLPTTGGTYRWMTTATAAATTTTDTIATGEWATPSVLAQDGVDGINGLNNSIVYLYQRSATGAPALPSATITYTFATGGMTGITNGWSTTFPAGTDPVYVTSATASNTGTTDTIASTEWASAVVLSQNGIAGLNSASVFLFQRTATSTAPSLPSANVTYTFATGVATGLTNGWTQTLPATGGAYRWITTATASNTTATDVIGSSEWAAASILAQDGTNGTNGTNGATGAAGPRGSMNFYVLLSGSTNTWSDSLATTTASVQGGPILNDTVTQYNNTVGFTQTKYWNGTSWILVTQVIDGGLLVTGSVSTPALAANSVVAGKIAAGAVTTDKLLVVGQGKALNMDPGCMDLSAWTIATGTISLASNVGAPSGTSALAIAASGSGAHVTSRPNFPIVGGRTYKISAQVRSTSSTGTLSIRMTCLDSSGSIVNYQVTAITPGSGVFESIAVPTAWTQYVGKITAGSTARTAYIEIYSNWSTGTGTTYITDFRCEEQIDSTVIVDGSITATQISATAGITAGQIDSRGLSIKDASGNVILSAGTVLANQITAGSGNIIQNGDFALSLSNIPTGFSVYNNDNVSMSNTIYSGGGAVGTANLWRQTFTSGGSVYGNGFSLATGVPWAGWQPSTDYVWSFYAKVGSGTNLLGSVFTLAWNHPPALALNLQNPPLTTSWQRYVFQVNFGSSTIDANGFVRTVKLVVNGDSLDFSCVQIETGTVPSGFAPLLYIDSSGVTRGNPSGIANPVNVANSNIAISGGAITGIGPGSGTAVANSNISIASNGVLSGAGGGQVTINGLGYTGSLNATADIILIPRGNCTVSGNTITKAGGANAWDSDCYSKNAYTGGAYATAVIPTLSYDLMFALNSDPTTDQSYTSLDYAWFASATAGSYYIYESGSAVMAGISAVPGDVLSIVYDGIYVYYIRNSTTIRQVSVATGQTLYFDSSFSSPGGYITNVGFGPMTNTGPVAQSAANAQSTANAAATAAADRVSQSAASVLSATVSINAVNGAGFRSGTLTWDSAGNRTGGYGVAMTPNGLLGVNSSGTTTFTLNATTGNAYFSGSLAVGTASKGATSGSINATATIAGGAVGINLSPVSSLTYNVIGGDILLILNLNVYLNLNTNTPFSMLLDILDGSTSLFNSSTNPQPIIVDQCVNTKIGSTSYNWTYGAAFDVSFLIPAGTLTTGTHTFYYKVNTNFYTASGTGNTITGSYLNANGQMKIREFLA